ncbi:MAG: DUF4906 domain-containing protein [Dysgonamonadaceae bacterium]|jgi:hypothetical protein|nr:DUF4906 domain-containing protein [Dysgonamonadaceae bacterium]
MKVINNIQRLYIVLLLLSVFALSSCIAESIPIDSPNDDSNDVTVVIHVPGPSRGNTRAIEQGKEYDNEVRRVDVLMFDAANGLYRGRVFSTDIKTGATENIKTFTVRIPGNLGNLDLMVLANAEEIIDAAEKYDTNPLEVGKTLKTDTDTSADRLLRTSLPNSTFPSFILRAWNADPLSSTFRPFPMSGEVLGFNISDDVINVNLTRMLAKINVRFADTPEGLAASNKLVINDIMLFNSNSEGYLVSRGYNQSATNVSQHTPDAITTPDSHGYNNLILYSNAAVPGTISTGLNVCVDKIFLFEVAASASAANRRDALSLIITGNYDGSPNPTSYRIDMVDSDGNYFDIIRNHYYDIVITNITGPGIGGALDTYNSKPFNITTQINAWDEAGMNDHTYDGRYELVIDKDNFTFDQTGSPAQPLKIYTDVPAGWRIEIPTASNWISVTPGAYNNSTVPFTSTTVQITCSPDNSGAPTREGSFFIVAGPFRREITVTQVTMMFAPPGVIGITAGGRLTLRGSNHYANHTAIENFAVNEFGGLENEPVWVVYYKWGSVVAMHSGINNTGLANNFTSADIAHAPAGYNLQGLISSLDAITGNTTGNRQSRYNLIPRSIAIIDNQPITINIAAGLGDPCAFADAGTSTFAYRTPIANPNWNGNAFTTGNLAWTAANAVAGIPVAGRMSTLAGQSGWFFPAAGHREINGTVESQSAIGDYWTNMSVSNNISGLILTFNSTAVDPANVSILDGGFLVRCVRQ